MEEDDFKVEMMSETQIRDCSNFDRKVKKRTINDFLKLIWTVQMLYHVISSPKGSKRQQLRYEMKMF